MPEHVRLLTDGDVEKLHSPTPSAHKRARCSTWANAWKEPGDCGKPDVMGGRMHSTRLARKASFLYPALDFLMMLCPCRGGCLP
jgi:hypothetical protein